MKKVLFIIAVIIAQVIQAQELKLKITISNAAQISSTVIIGADGAASEQLDAAFEEVNIYDSALNEVDLRSIQRTEEYHECLKDVMWNDVANNPVYFENNVDLRTDIRSLDWGDPINSCYEIKIKANNYPIQVKIEATEWQEYNPMYFYWIGLFDSTCNQLGDDLIMSYGDEIGFHFNETTTIDRFLVRLRHHVSVNETNQNNFKLYPNPVLSGEEFSISSAFEGTIEIYNSLGVKMLQQNVHSESKISTKNFEAGLYIIHFIDINGIANSKKLVIQNR